MEQERIEKNKKNEQDIEFPQEKAPHLSDAADTMMWGKCKVLLKRVQEFADIKAGLQGVALRAGLSVTPLRYGHCMTTPCHSNP